MSIRLEDEERDGVMGVSWIARAKGRWIRGWCRDHSYATKQATRAEEVLGGAGQRKRRYSINEPIRSAT